MSGIAQGLDHWMRAAVPSVLGVVMTLLSVMVWPIPYIGPIMPPLGFIALYYWSAYRPDLFPIGIAFGLGILNDILNDLPVGVSGLSFTLLHFLIVGQRRLFIGHSFWMLWAGFALSAGFLMILQIVLIDLVRWSAVPILPVMAQIAVAVLIFPLPCWALNRAQHHLLSAP